MAVFISISNQNTKVYGSIEIDDKSGLARVKIEDGNVSNCNVHTAKFKVVHGVELPREEQSL